MQDLIPLDWADLGFLNDDDGDSLANCIEDFERLACFLRRVTFMCLNDGGQITLMKTVLREILCQRHACKRRICHAYPSLSGKRVMNFVIPAYFSCIQMESIE